MIYQFSEGSHVSRKLDAQQCGAFIAALGTRDPAAIVEASRPASAPTHAHFPWKMTGREAKQIVLERAANQLVRSIRVVREDRPDLPALPAFVSIVYRDSEERAYMPTYQALGDAEYRVQVLSEARSSLLAWRRRYHELEELGRVFEAIDQLTLDEAAKAA